MRSKETNMNHPQMDRAKCERMQQKCVCRYLVLVEVGGLSDEGGVGIAGACPEGGHPIQQGADLEFKGNFFDVNQMKHVHHVKNKKKRTSGPENPLHPEKSQSPERWDLISPGRKDHSGSGH